MIFSKDFNIALDIDDDWFDPILSTDTKLFIDPFLVYESNHEYFSNAHEKTITFFNHAFTLAAESTPHPKDLRYRLLQNMMNFPEVEEICLGYASKGTSGSGAGGGFSKIIVDSIFESIRLGVMSFNRFEEIGLFNDGFGCDRISDMTATLLKSDFIKYTQFVCDKHKIPTKKIRIKQFEFNQQRFRWQEAVVNLPINPYTNKSIILVPRRFLRELPTISTDEFWDYCWTNLNEEIRDQYSFDVKNEVKKHDIINIARERRDWVNEFESYLDKTGSTAYDIVADPKGYYKWALVTEEFASTNKYKFIVASNHVEFYRFTLEVINQFENFIENNSGYKLLWDDNGLKPKSEEAVQLLFTGIVKHYCKANNIDLNREVNLGRGPVDFKFSSGYENRALIEVKLAKNSKFWNGLEKQLIKYLEVEEIKKGYFLVICYNDSDLQKVADIQDNAKLVSIKNNVSIDVIVIDASFDKPSASKL
jgi:hypothetical protein